MHESMSKFAGRAKGCKRRAATMSFGCSAAPEVQLLQGFEASHTRWHTPQHVVGNIQALQLAELAHAVRQTVQVVGAQVKLD